MELSFAPAKDGLPTCRLGDLCLHSAYSPAREAERFLEGAAPSLEASLSRPSASLVISGPCLDYLSPIVKRRWPGCRVLLVQFHAGFRGKEGGEADAAWYPDSRTGLEDFLSAHLDDGALGPVAFLEWPPAKTVFAAEAAALREILRGTLDRGAASAATTKALGRRWIRNSIRAFLSAEDLVEALATGLPAFVAASGPSLGPALELLAPLRPSFLLVAVSSALPALLARGLRPDLLVSTDPGFWSGAHLAPSRGQGIPRAAPLSSLPFPSAPSPLLALDQGGFPESELGAFLGPSIRLPPHGTVSGSSLALAALLTEGPIVLAGFDFAASPSGSHARPHAFEPFILRGEGRLAPGEGLRSARLLEGHPDPVGTSGWRSSRSLEIYARAVNRDAASLGGRVSRLCPSPVDMPGIPNLGAEGLAALAAGSGGTGLSAWRPLSPPPLERRRDFLAASLDAWERESEEALLGLAEGREPGARMGDFLRCVDLVDHSALLRTIRAGLPRGPLLETLAASVRSFLHETRERYLR